MIDSDSDSDTTDNPILKFSDGGVGSDATVQQPEGNQVPQAKEGKEPPKKLTLLEPPSINSRMLRGASIDSVEDELDVDPSVASIQVKQLYLMVARCIAYPFNAKLHVETAPPKPKLNEVMYDSICAVLKGCIEQDKSVLQELILTNSEMKCIRNKDFQNMVEWYFNRIMLTEDIKVICLRGCFSTKELENIFRVTTSKRFREKLLSSGMASATENLTKRIEGDQNFQVWTNTFGKLVEQGRQNSMTSKQKKELNRHTSIQTGNKEEMYRMFQDILKVSRKDHQSLAQTCQFNNSEEQEGVIRRELQRRRELVEKKILSQFWSTQSHVLREHFLEEQERNLKILSESLESESLISSDFGLKQKKKKTEEGGGVEPSKHDVHFNKKVKVTVRSLSQMEGIPGDKPVFIVFDTVDGEKPLATDMKELDSSGFVSFDTTGEFWTNSPLPQINLRLKIYTQGFLHEDKQIGKIIHTVMPTSAEVTETVSITRDDKRVTNQGQLRLSTFLERPTNMRKCGYLICQGDSIFRELKPRFLALILLSQFRFLLCHYQPKDNYPRDIILLDGCNVDYLNEDVIDIPKTHSDAYWFVLDAGSKGCIKFGCKTHAEREGWVKGLFRVTGQSNKPSDEIDGSTGGSVEDKSDLAEVINMDVTQLDHQQLFSKLFKSILSYRLDQPVFSRGLFSSSQMYVVDEFCARYSVRLSHRHLTCLWEWLNCELRGISIWPVMMLHSFGFCQMHIMGKAPQQFTEVVTPQERREWSQLSAQIELLLTEKLENFRTYFPFSCPKNDLKITMKLFHLVADINHSDGGNMSAALSSESHPMKLLNQIMERAALNNFKYMYSKLWEEEKAEEDESHLTVEQLYVLAQLCIEFMYELHEFYHEDFVLHPQAFNSHVDAFWSFFMVDMQETMNFVGEEDVVPLLKMFYSLNEYFILQPTLKLCNFHQSLLTLFEPIVETYLTGLDNNIGNDMKLFFDQETWMPVNECCSSMKGCIDALESVKQFVEHLHWPQEPFSDDLIYRVQCICADKFREAVRLIRLQCESATQAVTMSFDTVIPKPIISMVNTIMFLSVQAVPFCGLTEKPEQETNRQVELTSELQSFLETTLGDVFSTVIHRLCEPFQVILNQMAKLDPQTGVLSSLKSLLPTTIQVERYGDFIKLNFQHLSGTLVTAVFSQFILNWYETQLRLLARWLRNRPDFSLHTVQLESVDSILETIRQQFQEEDIEEEQLNTESYEEIEDRVKRERQQAAMMKAFKKQ